MTVSLGLKGRRDALADRLSWEPSVREVTRDGPPEWFETLLTEVVLAVGDSDIRYLSARHDPVAVGGTGRMSLVLFADELVVYATLELDPHHAFPIFEVSVTARRSLQNFSIETTEGFDHERDTLDGLRISVSYPNLNRTLPLGESAWKDRGLDTRWLLESLRSDLVR